MEDRVKLLPGILGAGLIVAGAAVVFQPGIAMIVAGLLLLALDRRL